MRDIAPFEDFVESRSAILETRSKWEEHLDTRISALQNYRRMYSAFHDELDRRMPKVKEALRKFGLEINSEVSAHKTGGPGSDSVWAEDDQLKASFSAAPVGGRFKFIGFTGYDKDGAGKNHGRLLEKAKAMVDAIEAASGLACQVNHYSLQSRRDGKPGRVLVDMWVKKDDVKA